MNFTDLILSESPAPCSTVECTWAILWQYDVGMNVMVSDVSLKSNIISQVNQKIALLERDKRIIQYIK